MPLHGDGQRRVCVRVFSAGGARSRHMAGYRWPPASLQRCTGLPAGSAYPLVTAQGGPFGCTAQGRCPLDALHRGGIVGQILCQQQGTPRPEPPSGGGSRASMGVFGAVFSPCTQGVVTGICSLREAHASPSPREVFPAPSAWHFGPWAPVCGCCAALATPAACLVMPPHGQLHACLSRVTVVSAPACTAR
jgi:hypothetical protein